MLRWLSEEEKQEQLASLKRLYPKANQRQGDGLDTLWVPFLRQLNKIEGVVTLQSCQGHEKQGKVGRMVWAPHLTIKCSELVSKKMYLRLYDLAAVRGVRDVSILMRDQVMDEVLDVQFESGLREGRLMRSFETVLSVIVKIAKWSIDENDESHDVEGGDE